MPLQDRRAWILESLGALGLLTAAGGLAAGQHDHAAASDEGNRLLSSDWKPAVLSPDEDRTLINIAEAIVPGAKSAACDRVIDLLLTLETDSVRTKFRESLAAFEKESQSRWQQPFERLSSGRQAALLSDASVKGAPLAPSFENLKSWVADVYWSSQVGMRELGYKGRMAWTTFPGCAHGGAHT